MPLSPAANTGSRNPRDAHRLSGFRTAPPANVAMKPTSKASSGPAKDPLKEVRHCDVVHQLLPPLAPWLCIAGWIGSRIRRLGDAAGPSDTLAWPCRPVPWACSRVPKMLL